MQRRSSFTNQAPFVSPSQRRGDFLSRQGKAEMYLTSCVFLCYTVNEDKKGGFSMAFCPQCGAPLPDGANFCMSCSARITAFGSEGSSALRMFI
ncbi:MAG: zinc ribbon domain-containing protein, partial [Clostridia bacterium]|nr:zinc ribbon domain-containing protein [Clostridia bacterium]